MDIPEATPWYVALVVALMGAALAALRPFFGWAEREYGRYSEHRRALERAHIEEMRKLSHAVGKLTCVVEGLQSSVDSMHNVLIAIYSPERLRELARATLQGERDSSKGKGKQP
jgi:hypothetical protein